MEELSLKKVFNHIKNNSKIDDVCKELELQKNEIYGLIERLKLEGYEINIVEEDENLVIKKRDRYKKDKNVKLPIEELEKVELCVVTDTHLCAKHQQLSLLNNVYQEAYDRGINTVLHCGDVVDGDYRNKRPAHPYDLFRQGFDQQTEYVIEMYPEIKGITTYFIEGSHDQTHFLNGGATVGNWVEKLRPDMKFLGVDDSIFKAGEKKKLDILMKHPGGGVAKAYSYKLQEAINKIPSGSKPKILLHGHFHKSYYMFYRNVHAFCLPCLCDISNFMKRMDIPNIVGAYFITAYINNKGEIQYIEPEEYLFDSSQIKKDDYKRCKKLTIK